MQVKDIADLVRDAVPGSTVSLAEDAGPDLRNYRVDFSKLAGTFPDLDLRWRVRDGVNELVEAYARHGLTYDDFMSARFVRLRRIRELLSAGLVDENLRRQTSGPFPMPDAEIAHEARLCPVPRAVAWHCRLLPTAPPAWRSARSARTCGLEYRTGTPSRSRRRPERVLPANPASLAVRPSAEPVPREAVSGSGTSRR